MLNKYGLNVARAFLAILLFSGGLAKLVGIPEVLESFSVLGLPSWFGYFIGVCEVAGAIGLFFNPLSALAASGLAFIMMGAIFFHVVHTPIAEGIPAFIALVFAIYIAIKKRSQLYQFNDTQA